jgi:hypothetical protein
VVFGGTAKENKGAGAVEGGGAFVPIENPPEPRLDRDGEAPNENPVLAGAAAALVDGELPKLNENGVAGAAVEVEAEAPNDRLG